MLKNYLLIAQRYLLRHPGYTALNIFGLALGLAAMGALLLYVHHQFSYDRHHENADQIRRVVVHQKGNAFMGSDHFGVTMLPLAPAIRAQLPQAETATVLATWPNQWIEDANGERFYGGVLWSDAFAFDVFTFDVVEGALDGALIAPNQAVITRSFAEKLYGTDSAIGNVITYSDDEPATVMAVVEDMPETSRIQFDFALPMMRNSSYEQNQDEWSNSSYQTYILTRVDTQPAELDVQLQAMVTPNLPENWIEQDYTFYTEALTDIHLFSKDAFATGADFRMLLLLMGAAFLILLIACTNYVNMATAQMALRTREVGVRKVIGAHRSQVLIQFMAEAALLVVTSVALGFGMLELALPFLSDHLGATLTIQPMLAAPGFLILFGVATLTTLFAGGYPALVLSKMRPVQILKAKGLRSQRRPLRSLLVTGQFVSAIVLGSVSLLVFQQLDYANTKDMGYDREGMISLNLNGLVVASADEVAESRRDAFVQEVLAHSAIAEGALGSASPFNINSQNSFDSWDGRTEGDDRKQAYQMRIDERYTDVYDIALVAGRYLDAERDLRAEDSDLPNAVLVNQTFVEALGWTPQEAIGKGFGAAPEYDYAGNQIVGVVEDFHSHSLHLPIAPVFMQYSTTTWMGLHLRPAQGRTQEALAHLEETFAAFAPKAPFTYTFASDAYAKMYAEEQQMGTLISIFTLLTVLIACLGIGGLSAFVARQRTREIGLRKALGATTAQILGLFSKDLVRLTLTAFVIGAPIAYVIIDQWLAAFSYRVPVQALPFMAVGVLALAAALLAACYPAFKATQINPAETLRAD
ncbi:MAG: FtsX-like permease family protein [Bacteroidota bacterium]